MSDERPLDDRIQQGMQYFFNNIPFNNMLNLKVSHASLDRFVVHLDMHGDLVGNFIHGILHGGVISTMLDVAGGGMAVIGAFERTRDMPEEEQINILGKIGTIDLRVDYLRPGKGAWFRASARLLRVGNKVAVTRMELHNDQDELLAVGTGTYLCG